MNIGRKSRIANVSGKTPTHRVQDGYKVITEKVPAQPDTRKYVDPQGNVRRVVLGNRVGEGEIQNPYGAFTKQQLAKDGWVLYAECPIGVSVRVKGEERCRGTHPTIQGAFWTKLDEFRYAEDECCDHVEQLIKERRAEHEERQREYGEQFTGSSDKLYDLMKRQAEKEAEMALSEDKVPESKRGRRAKVED